MSKTIQEVLTEFLSNTTSPSVFHSEGAKYHRDQALKEIEAIMLEVVGKDEMSFSKNIRPMSLGSQQQAIARNSLRIKQRHHLQTALYGKELE